MSFRSSGARGPKGHTSIVTVRFIVLGEANEMLMSMGELREVNTGGDHHTV